MIPLRVAQWSSTFVLPGYSGEDGRIITVDMYRKVRLACAEGMSQREAARHFGVSRDGVSKMLAFSVPPGYRRTALVKRPKLDEFTGIIDGWLEGDRGVHRKQRHTAKTNDQAASRRARPRRRRHDLEGLCAQQVSANQA